MWRDPKVILKINTFLSTNLTSTKKEMLYTIQYHPLNPYTWKISLMLIGQKESDKVKERIHEIQHHLLEPTYWKTFLDVELLVGAWLWKPGIAKEAKFLIS